MERVDGSRTLASNPSSDDRDGGRMMVLKKELVRVAESMGGFLEKATAALSRDGFESMGGKGQQRKSCTDRLE